MSSLVVYVKFQMFRRLGTIGEKLQRYLQDDGDLFLPFGFDLNINLQFSFAVSSFTSQYSALILGICMRNILSHSCASERERERERKEQAS